MAVKIITMEIVSKKSGKGIEVSSSMDEGLFKASFSLPKKRIPFLTEAYHELKREEKRKRRLLSLDSMFEDCTEFEDGLVDDNLNQKSSTSETKETFFFTMPYLNSTKDREKSSLSFSTMGRIRDNWPRKWA